MDKPPIKLEKLSVDSIANIARQIKKQDSLIRKIEKVIPSSEQVTPRFSNNCIAFLQKQKKLNERQRKKIEKLNKKPTRSRLPKTIAEVLIFYLHKYAGNEEAIIELCGYLSGGDFARDLIRCKRSIEKMIWSELDREDDGQASVTIPARIENLQNNRGDPKDIHRWRAQWIHDLIRTVASSGNVKTKKNVKPSDRAKIIEHVYWAASFHMPKKTSSSN